MNVNCVNIERKEEPLNITSFKHFPKAAATSASVEKVNSKGRGNTGRKTLEIRAVKLRFLLIYEIMLKGIATTRSECTAKQENKASYNTYYMVPDLIDFFGDE